MKTQIMKGASILTAMLFFSMLLAPVFAAPQQPFDRLGDTVYNTTVCGSWIDGVQYGIATTSGTGYLEISTDGDDTAQATEKIGGNAGDVIQYSVGSLTGATGRFFAVAENDVFAPAGSFTGDLTADGADTILLKIDVLASQSTVVGLPDYIVIYNPHTAAVNAGGYSLAVGTAGAQAIVVGDIPTGLATNNNINIPAAGSLVIDMTKWGGLATGGNAVKLIYTTGSRVVDRVEYGTIATEPENTMMTNAAAPASAQEIYRNGHADTNACAADFLSRAQSVVRDITAPTITATTFADTATGVSIVAGFYEATWSEPMAAVGSVTTNLPGAVGSWQSTTVYRVTYTALSFNTVYTLTYTGFTDVVGNAATGDLVKTFTTELQTLTTITITTDPVTITTMWVGTMPVSAQGYDQYGTAMSFTPVWSDNAAGTTYTAPTAGSPATGTFNADGTQIAGTYTITVTNGGAVSDTAVLQINPYVPVLTTITITTDPVAITTMWVGTLPVSAQGYDQYSVAMSFTPTWSDNAAGTSYTAPTAGSPATATFNADGTQVAGSYVITVTNGGAISDTAVLTITAYTPVLTTITITTDPVTIPELAVTSAPVSAQGYDQYGVAMSFTPVWSDNAAGTTYSGATAGSPATGTLDADGTQVDGSYIITVTNGGAISDTAVLTITAYTPVLTTITITTDPVTFADTFIGTQPVSAQGYDQLGVAMSFTPVWSDDAAGTTYSGATAGSPATGTLNADGTQTAGSYTITVTNGGAISDTAVLTITSGGVIPAQVNTLTALGHTPVAADCRLSWTEMAGATSYNVYRSTQVNGLGFNFAVVYANVPMSGTGTVVWDDVGAYATADNYAWVVRSVGSGENTTDKDNIGFKLVKTLFSGTAAIGATDNYIALPYRFAFTTAATLITDMRNFGSPTGQVSSVNRWNQNTGGWEARSAFAGTNFAVTPGEGYRAVVTAATVTWKIVGAYNSSVIKTMFTGTATVGATDNYIALPYHGSLITAATLITSMRNTGSPTGQVSSVNRWNQNTGGWEARSAFAGTNFVVTPGECYRAVVTAPTVTWTPVVTTPGA